MRLKFLLMLLVACSVAICARAQVNPDAIEKIARFPASFFSKVNKRAASLENRLTSKTEKYLRRLARQEIKLPKKLNRIDSNAAKQLFVGSALQYQQLIKNVKGSSVGNSTGMSGEYIPRLDSLKTSLSFLQQNKQLLGNNKELRQKVNASLGRINEQEGTLQQNEAVKTFIQQERSR